MFFSKKSLVLCLSQSELIFTVLFLFIDYTLEGGIITSSHFEQFLVKKQL